MRSRIPWGFRDNIFRFMIKYWMDYTAHEYVCIHRKYLTIPWHFSTIFNLKIKICRLLINIHEVAVFCGVSQHICNILFYLCESLPQLKKQIRQEGRKRFKKNRCDLWVRVSSSDSLWVRYACKSSVGFSCY